MSLWSPPACGASGASAAGKASLWLWRAWVRASLAAVKRVSVGESGFVFVGPFPDCEVLFTA